MSWGSSGRPRLAQVGPPTAAAVPGVASLRVDPLTVVPAVQPLIRLIPFSSPAGKAHQSQPAFSWEGRATPSRPHLAAASAPVSAWPSPSVCPCPNFSLATWTPAVASGPTLTCCDRERRPRSRRGEQDLPQKGPKLRPCGAPGPQPCVLSGGGPGEGGGVLPARQCCPGDTSLLSRT